MPVFKYASSTTQLCLSFRKNCLLLWYVGDISAWKWPIQCERHRPKCLHPFDLFILRPHSGCYRAHPWSIFGFERKLWPRKHWEIHFTEATESEIENNGSDWWLEWGICHILRGKSHYSKQEEIEVVYIVLFNFQVAASYATRLKFAQNVVRFCRIYNFDGIDIDWEYPARRDGNAAIDKNNFVLLLEELHRE